MKKKILIAIDGPSASGKGTLSYLLSKELKIPHLNTGGLYRAVAYKAIKLNCDFNNIEKLVEIANNLKEEDITNREIFTEEMGGNASIVAKIQKIRDTLFKFQRNFAEQETGAILDGRDIGTVICPDADYKFYITASSEERAKRRYKEMVEKGIKISFEEILKKIEERDNLDKNRKVNPFVIAKDAITIDTTNKTIQEVFKETLSYIK